MGEAAALCAIDVESERDECDDGCDDSAETCTIMDKLWNVIGTSDECRAFKSWMEELEKGKQNQVKRVLRIAYRRLRRVELCEARAAAKADGIHRCQRQALNVAPVEGYMKWALATAGTLYCSKCAAVDFAYCGLLTARNPGENTCTVQCNSNWQEWPYKTMFLPGCYVKTPTNCPKQSFSAPDYTRDTWGEANRNAAKDKNACLVTRKKEYDSWCGSSDTTMKFVPGFNSSYQSCMEEAATHREGAAKR